MKIISFIIPCYGSEKTIEFVVTELNAKMSEKPGIDYEIIAVNDCSPDAIWSVLNHLSEQHSCLKLIDLAKNMNRPGAVMAGLRMSSGDIAVIMDDDGQCPVSELWRLLEPLQHDFDVSIAKYPQRKQTWFKSFGTWFNQKMTEFIIKKPRHLEFTNFMAIKRYIVDEMIRYENPYPYLTGLILRSTKHITNVEMEQRSRFIGTSSFTFLKMFSLWSNGLTAFSVRPLRMASVMGFIFAALGFLYGIWTVILKVLRPSVPAGYSSIIVFLLIIGGIIMLMLGLIGEYIGRIYISLNNSPQYVIRKTVGFTKNN